MSNHAEGPVTVQDVEDHYRRFVTTQMTGPPTFPGLPRPKIVLARMRDYPVAVERGREHGYDEALVRISSGEAAPTDTGGAWFSMDTADLRRHFDQRTVDDVAFCYELGWMQGWDDYCQTCRG